MGYKTNQPTASCPASCGQAASTLTGTVVCEGSDGSIASDSKCSGTKPSAPTKSCDKTSDCVSDKTTDSQTQTQSTPSGSFRGSSTTSSTTGAPADDDLDENPNPVLNAAI